MFTGSHLIDLPEAGSTNSLAAQLLPDAPPEGTVIRTAWQTAGRGQQGNSWQVAPGLNLTFSVIYYPHFLPAARVYALSKITALALRECVAHWRPEAVVQIKWPNDLLLNRRKVAGILIENQLGGGYLRSAIIGIGLNVNQTDFPPALGGRATSLAAAGGPLSLEAVFQDLLARLEAGYLRVRAGHFDHIDRAYLAHLYGYQETVTVRIGDHTADYSLVGVDAHGRLALDTGAGLRYFDVKEAQVVVA